MSITIEYHSNESLAPSCDVKVAGSFSNWEPMLMTRDSNHVYSTIIETVNPGDKVWYKFIVDGVWKLSDEGLPQEFDEHGNANHVLTVKAEATKSETAKSESTIRHRKRSNSVKSTTSTVMVVYDRKSPIVQFFSWVYYWTFGGLFRLFGI